MTHTVYALLQLLVGADGHLAGEGIVTAYGRKAVLSPELGVLGTLHQPFKHGSLQGLALCVVLLQFPLTGGKHLAYYTC